MVGAVGVEVFEVNPAIGADHEGRTDLLHPRAGFVGVVSSLGGRSGRLPRSGVEEFEPREGAHGRRVRCRAVVVDQYLERDLLLDDEAGGVSLIAGPDGNDAAAQPDDLIVSVAELRGMLAAVKSTEMTQEHQHDRLVAPEITEPVVRAGAVSERERSERVDVHGPERRPAVAVRTA